MRPSRCGLKRQQLDWEEPATAREDGQESKEVSLSAGWFCGRKTYDFGVGLLSIQVVKVSTLVRSLPNHNRNGMRLKVSFIPPWWMSRTALQASIDFPSRSLLYGTYPMVNLTPIAINQDPELLESLHSLDLSRIQRLFEANQARPTDMVVDLETNEPISLSEASLSIESLLKLVSLPNFAGIMAGIHGHEPM